MTNVKNLILCVLMLALVDTATGATLYVNTDGSGGAYTSIQDAIDAAVDGVDEIEVAPGTYNEAINFNGKAIRLYSSSDNPDDTIINGNGAYHVVQCVSGEGSGTKLEGFTITGGNANGSPPDNQGGGMLNIGSSPTVTNCRFENNLATGGLVTTWEPGLWYSTLPGNINTTDPNPQTSATWDLHETEDADLPENTTEVYTGMIFAALDGSFGFTEHNDDKTRLYIDLNADGDFDDSGELVLSSDYWLDRVEGYVNLTAGEWYGFELRMSNGDGLGGIVEAPCFAYCLPGGGWEHPEDPGDGSLFRHAVITGAESEGGGMYNDNSSPTVTNCIFYGNTTTGYGGGMSNNASSPTVTGCTFESNSAQQAGGMYNDNGSSPTVTGCGFTNNTTAGSGGGMRNVESDPILTNCTFTANSGYYAGGLSSIRSNPTLTGCSFIGNSADKAAGGLGCYYGTPELTNCTFTNNSAENGGGVNLENGDSPILKECTFLENSADYGGGLNNWDSSPTMTNCTFTGNTATVNGGGIASDEDSSPTLTNCTFTANHAAVQGGAMVCYSGGSPTVSGCTFSENSADDRGGGMFNQESSPSVDNCSFSGNSAGQRGGGMYNNDSSPTVTGCTFSGNNGGHSGGGMCNWPSSSPTVTNCNFTGNQANYGGAMRNDDSSNPTVTNCTFTSNTGQYGAGMFNFYSSPTVTNCTFSGNSAGYSGGGMYNDDSSPTVTNCTFSGNSAGYAGGGIYSQGIVGSSPTVTNCILWGNTPDEIYDGFMASTTVTYSDVQGVIWPGPGNINADPLFVDATAGDLRLASSGSPCVDTGINSAPSLPPTDLAGNPRVVDGDENGSAIVDMGAYEFQPAPIHNITQDIWYGTIQSAIDDSTNDDLIEVGPGTYYEAIDFQGKPIHLCSTGGPGATTIDGGGAYHVVQCVNGEGIDTILEGFTITGGNADGAWPNERGAGMYNEGSSPTVTNCIFTGNTATDYGGGMSNNASSPTVIGCSFEGNSANFFGGMHNGGSNPTVTDCTFTGNTAGSNGGGMGNTNSSPDVINCTFSGNSANYGGAMSSIESSPIVTNCSFISNEADAGGGGMDNYYSDAILTNCTFIGNSAAFGGAVWNSYTSPDVAIANCILWGDSGGEIGGGTPTVTYSDVEGGWEGTGNIDADPMFADGAGRLSSGSPCIEAGDNGAVPGDIETDLDGNLRIADGDRDEVEVVDMGAYEYVWTDTDEDGIEDSVDTEPLVYSDDFADGLTSGTILDREDQILFVSNAPDPCGVKIKASASGGPTPAQVSVCGEAAFYLDAGDAVVATCGSVKIAVLQGMVEIVFIADDGTEAQTSLNAGNGIEFEAETCTLTAPSTNTEKVIVVVDGEVLTLAPGENKMFARIDIDPDTLNLKSKGKWITCYIELPQGFDVGDIDVGTVMLNGEVLAQPHPTTVGDYDGDGVADLMVKFDRAATQALLEVADAVQISVAGQLNDGTVFEGSDTIRVIKPGKQNK